MTLKKTIFTHRPPVSFARFTFYWWLHNRLLMTSQRPDNCDASPRKVISNPLLCWISILFTAIFTARRVGNTAQTWTWLFVKFSSLAAMEVVKLTNSGAAIEMMTSWWRYQMETFSALPAICAGNSPVIGEFSAQRPVTRSFCVFFDLCLNKRLSKQWWGWWF